MHNLSFERSIFFQILYFIEPVKFNQVHTSLSNKAQSLTPRPQFTSCIYVVAKRTPVTAWRRCFCN